MREALTCGVLAILTIASVPPYADARQDPVRETLVVTASAAPVPLGSVTRTIAVISREQLEQLPVHTVADALRLIAAVDVRARGVRGMQTDFAIRGATFGQTLVLVDGIRLNDSQTGHHNGDIPVPLASVERIEILQGPGSSLFGADAFGGTINIITRRELPAAGHLEVGSFGFVGGGVQASVGRGAVRGTLAGFADQSSGFMTARDFGSAGLSSRTWLGERTRLLADYLWKGFGANGFYGPSPSREWTNQALFGVEHRVAQRFGWRVDGLTSYRTHGDRFLWDERRPGVLENRHRTHAAIASVKASRPFSGDARLVVGLEGGADWIRSSNLGDHSIQRASAFGEWRQPLGASIQLDAGLRADRYSEFGTAWSPSIGVGWSASRRLRVRASGGRAFRIPTFTERYYSDPAHLARAEVRPETAWAAEVGANALIASGWSIGTAAFRRWEDDVIDWLRATPGERWRTYNVRNVRTNGVELTARRAWPNGRSLQLQYAWLQVRAPSVNQFSKYVLDFAPHSVTATAALPSVAGVTFAPRIEFRNRTRSSMPGAYTLVDARVSRRFGRYELGLEGTNLLDATYQEVVGAAMPGRAVSASIRMGGR